LWITRVLCHLFAQSPITTSIMTILATAVAVVSMLPTNIPPSVRLTPSSSSTPSRMSAPIMSLPSSPLERRRAISASTRRASAPLLSTRVLDLFIAPILRNVCAKIARLRHEQPLVRAGNSNNILAVRAAMGEHNPQRRPANHFEPGQLHFRPPRGLLTDLYQLDLTECAVERLPLNGQRCARSIPRTKGPFTASIAPR